MISYFASITVIKASPRWWKHVYPFTLISWKVQGILICINSLRKKTKCKSNSDYNVSWCRLKLERFEPKFRRYRPLILKSEHRICRRRVCFEVNDRFTLALFFCLQLFTQADISSWCLPHYSLAAYWSHTLQEPRTTPSPQGHQA